MDIDGRELGTTALKAPPLGDLLFCKYPSFILCENEKKKKNEEKNILMYAVFFKLGCNMSLAKIICQYLENKLHETPRCFCFNLLGKSTERHLGALSKRRLLEIRKSHLFESFHASKAALCADRAGTVTGRSLLAKLSGGLPTPSSSIPAMILFCSNRSKF